MKRLVVIATAAAFLISMLPSVVSAARPVQFSERRVGYSCDTDVDGGHLAATVDSDSLSGAFANATVWLDPAIPFVDPPTVTGFSTVVAVDDAAAQVVLSATFTAVDGAGTELGQATLTAAMNRVGAPEVTDLTPPPRGNHHWFGGTQTLQPLAGTVTFTWPGGQVAAECSGELVDIEFAQTSPTSFVESDAGTGISCSWSTTDAVAFLDVSGDTTRLEASAFFSTPGVSLEGVGEASGSIDSSSMSVTIGLIDEFTGATAGSATASADLAPIGEPVTSTIISQTRRVKLTEQALTAAGSLEFPTGDTFTIDDDHCSASSFSYHTVANAPSGPGPGTAPPNDTPDGAIALSVGSKLNVRTTGAEPNAEVDVGCTLMGRSVWYTIVGTGDPIAVSTAGSNFDTVAAAFTSDGSTFTEIACNDDDNGDPFGVNLQGSLTFDTVAGETYWIEVGGFFGESGRLRLAVS